MEAPAPRLPPQDDSLQEVPEPFALPWRSGNLGRGIVLAKVFDHGLGMLFMYIHLGGLGRNGGCTSTRVGGWPIILQIRLEHPNCAEGLREKSTTGNENSRYFSSPESSPATVSSATESSRWSIPLGGMSVCQLAAASSTPAATSWISGLCVLSPSQHFWMSTHRDPEIPIASAFAGLSGRTPDEM